MSSASWDEDYKRDVLEPARAAGDQPPEDLRVRYRLTEPLRAPEVVAQVKRVRQCWRRSRGQLKYRKLIDRLEADHRELVPLFTAAESGDLEPLAARLRGGAERTARRRAEARSRLVDAAGGLRLVTPADLEGIARSSGVTRAELEQVAEVERIEVRDPDVLPATAPYAGYRKVRESLDVLGHRQIPDFLFGGRLPGPMRVLDGFAAPGARMSADVVQRVSAEWARRPRDTSSTHADTVLIALRSAQADELIRYDVVERLRERHRQRASERALLRHATEGLGVDQDDARRLVFAVLRESGPGGGTAGRLRALLDAGEVHAAALLAERAKADPESGEPSPEAELLAEEAGRRVAEGLRLREAAAAETDPDRAWLLLADALQLVRDLPGAEERQRGIPPRPVPRATAAVDGARVRLSWTPSPSAAGEITYLAVRQESRPPQDLADGVALAVTEPAKATGARDERPPVNVPLYYGVAARRGDATAELAVAGPVFVRPEPGEVALEAGDGRVTGRWRRPAEAARVLVTRSGAEVPSGREGFGEEVPNGVTHHYRIAAVYLDAGGHEIVTPGILRSVTPSAPPDPVIELAAGPDPVDDGRVLVRFAQPEHGTAEIVLLDGPPPWPRSALVPVEEIRRISRRVPSTPTGEGLAVRPGGSGVLLAVTLSGDQAAVGASHRHVDLPAPRALTLERRGTAVHVGFDWPPDVAEVMLAYRVGTGDRQRTIVTRAAYEAGGGIRLAAESEDRVEVSVAAAGVAQSTRLTGPETEASVPGRVLVGYDLDRAGPPWRRELVVRLTSPQPLRIGRLELVRRGGRVMPQRPEDGETLGSWTQVPVPGEVSLPLPAGSGPYWLRCFADDDVIELTDPPVRRLQSKR